MSVLRKLALSLAVVGVLSAFGAGAASAFTWTSWNPGWPVKETGSLTFERANGTQVACSFDVTLTTLYGEARGTCANGASLQMLSYQMPGTEAGAYVVRYFRQMVPLYGPWGAMTQDPNLIPFVPGNALTPSTMVFNNTPIARLDATGETIKATGTITVTTPTGGLVTIN